MSTRKLILATAAMLCTVPCFLAFTIASAQAAVTHDFVGSLGPAGLGSSSSFSEPLGVAVDQSTEDMYVYTAEYNEAIESVVPFIYKFNAAGEPEEFSGLGSDVIEGSGVVYDGYSQIAVDSSSGPDAGDIYVVEGEHVTVYGADGDQLGELNGEVEEDGGPWGLTCGVAVDAAGNVYVGLYEGYVDKYKPSGGPVGNSDYESSLTGLSEGSCNLAADSEGDIYVTLTPGESQGPVMKYEALQFGSLAAVGTEIAEHGRAVAVDPAASDDDLYVDEGSEVVQYDSAGSLLGKFGTSGAGMLSGYSNGIAVNRSSGEVYVSNPEANPEEEYVKGVVDIYGPASVVLPNVSLTPVSELKPTSVTFNGTVDPEDEGAATCQFEYAAGESYTETGTYEYTVPCSASSIPSGNIPVAVSAAVTGLTPNTTYDFRLDASNASGTNYGQDATVTTTGPPVIGGLLETSDVSPFEVTVHGEVNPENSGTTTYHVEYGFTSTYGKVFAPEGNAGEGFGDVSVVEVLAGLQPGTTYHYALVATNPQGSVTSPDETFTTPAAFAPDVTTGPASNVTTGTATIAGTINPEGLHTTYTSELGTSTSYTTQVFGEVGSSTTEESVTMALGDLQPGTTYHYRVTATNAAGTTYGTDESFTTAALPSSGIIPPTPLAFVPTPVFPNINTGPIEPLTKPPTRAQELVRALKKCKKDKSKKKRLSCKQAAKAKYGTKTKKKK